MVSISTYSQWALRRFLKKYFLVQMWKYKFHKTNKLSSNRTWVHSRTSNVISYFQDKAFHGKAVCLLGCKLLDMHTYVVHRFDYMVIIDFYE